MPSDISFFSFRTISTADVCVNFDVVAQRRCLIPLAINQCVFGAAIRARRPQEKEEPMPTTTLADHIVRRIFVVMLEVVENRSKLMVQTVRASKRKDWKLLRPAPSLPVCDSQFKV
jgi:hypothetical protein